MCLLSAVALSKPTVAVTMLANVKTPSDITDFPQGWVWKAPACGVVLNRLCARHADSSNLDSRQVSAVCGMIAFMEITLHVFRNSTNINVWHFAFKQRSDPSLRLPGPRQTGFRKMIFFFSPWSSMSRQEAEHCINRPEPLSAVVCTETDTVLYNDQVS